MGRVQLVHGERILQMDESLAALGDVETAELTLMMRSQMQIAMEAVAAAQERLQNVKKCDITEVKSYARIPDILLEVLCAVMIVLERKDSFDEAKKWLGDPAALRDLLEFRVESMTLKTLKKLRRYTHLQHFTPEAIQAVSTLCAALCQWVLAVKSCSEAMHEESSNP